MTIRLWWLTLAALFVNHAHSFTSLSLAPPRRPCYPLFSSYGEENSETAALRSITDFHEGKWKGKAVSFAVTSDVAAGIVQRKTSPTYTSTIRLGVNLQKRHFTMTEDFQWESGESSTRKVSLTDSHVDVDDVDGSYSLDATLPDFPATLIGTDKLQGFVIEHCIATSDHTRSRCLVFYGVDQQLMRVVVADEDRISNESNMNDRMAGKLTPQDLMEMEGDVDRLVEKLTRNMNGTTSVSTQETYPQTSTKSMEQTTRMPHLVSLLELSSGVWLGDSVIRDLPQVPISPLQRGKGFGTLPASATNEVIPFASWSLGVQKVAWRWMWNFGEEIRQVNDFGKALGASIADALKSDLAGSVCVNEGLSRRITKEERMVYIDWTGDNVGFLVGSKSIQVPRFLNFDRTRQIRPFYTEFCCYLKAALLTREDAPEETVLPDIVCSKISRVYNYEGRLKQGCTSFYSLKRFGMEDE
ncbi:hypothetical protein FisN_4Lh415 [Fistulifera solaris]|uniref:Uncharacterized protein n=1 Tax=Fistulifera solaris TaxID=1519565 RepID=A0A1Z5KDG5_FISSO|nr:hypothetical protein FisN_4Lh415 [Fistulifera solaris]|eukprot:GAX24303.1 hypothetical protein FisN_4Lh415 [Fistulifera solaris]